MDEDQISRLLKRGTAAERKAFVEGLPHDGMTRIVADAMDGSDTMVVCALGAVAGRLCSGADPQAGAPLAKAVHQYAVELFEGGNRGLLATTLSALASNHVNALSLLGRYEDVLAAAERYVPYYERIAEPENLPAMRAARIEALVNLQRIDEADEALAAEREAGRWDTSTEFARLAAKVEALKRTIFQTRGAPSTPAQREERRPQAVAPGAAAPVDAATADVLSALQRLLKIGTSVLTGDSPRESEWTIKNRIIAASGIFGRPAQPTREEIAKSQASLSQSLQLASSMGLTEAGNEALWGLYLCHSRLKEHSPAADALLRLRQNLETTRAAIKDPVERGGVLDTFPHLLDALCCQLQLARRTADLLVAIEASKGRGMADILTMKGGGAVPDRTIYESAGRLPDLTKTYGFHYLSYYVDLDWTYAVLVSRAGEICPLEPVPVSRRRIQDASAHADPRLWGAPSELDPSRAIEDVSDVLSPLVRMLEPLVDQRILAPDDHICYSADDNFHNIPLQYLKFRDRRLVDFFSLSRIHNAFHLDRVLRRRRSSAYAGYLSFRVPTAQDRHSEFWPRRQHALTRPTERLADLLDGRSYENEDASLARLRAADLRDKVIQFSTHGVFPREREEGNPFTDSGLVMSDGGVLPDQDAVALGSRDPVLTPAKVLDMKLDFSDSHVSMMACVSGLSRDAVGGDALGMDWALIQAGAASMLSSHWDVSTELAADFLVRFYDEWLGKRRSRAEALRRTVMQLRQEQGARGTPYSWAAFSLTGDWH